MAKPKLALIPASQGSELFSVLPSSGVGDFDFSRSGRATRINSQGLIEEVANGQSRLNYPMIDGKVVGCPHHILEPSRTNLITRSEEVNLMTLSSVSVIADNTISPDGTLNADKLTPVSTGFKTVRNFLSSSIGSLYTISFFYKNVDHTKIGFYDNNTAGSEISINLKTNDFSLGSAVTDGGIEYYGNGWYRAYATFPASTSLISNYLIFRSETNNGNYTATGSSMYAWGFQVEQGSYPTSYIKSNSGSTTTRSAETANNSGDASTFNDSEGVLMAEISALVSGGSTRVISLSGGSQSVNNIYISFNTSGGVSCQVLTSGGSVNLSTTNVNQENTNKLLLKYKSNDFSLWINGFEVDTDTSSSSTPIGLDRLNFDFGSGSFDFYGKTKQIQYYNSALTDSELEQLTSWTSFTDMAEGQLYTIE